MDVFEAIYTRRSIRKFLQTPIEFDKLVEIMKAGSYAPCAGNLQNWKFILEVKQEKIKGLHPYTLEQDAFLTAPAAILVVAEVEADEKMYGMRGKRLYAIQNCAAAVQNILLSAHALGLGAVWVGAFEENKVNDMYSVPPNARVQAIILIGYPDEQPQPRHMKDVWYLINFDRYGLKYQRPHLITHDLSVEWSRKAEEWRQAANRKKDDLSKRMGVGQKKEGTQPSQKAGEFFVDAHKRAKVMLEKLKKDPPRRQ